jgi:hypothetical protein
MGVTQYSTKKKLFIANVTSSDGNYKIGDPIQMGQTLHPLEQKSKMRSKKYRN